MRVGVIGSGKLSKALLEKLPLYLPKGASILAFHFGSTELDVCIHAGSGRSWDEALSYCSSRKIPLIQASTPSEQVFPSTIPFVGISAPNLCIPVLKFTKLAATLRALMPDAPISLVESHQKEKTTRAATSELIAQKLKIPIEQITHIRDAPSQLKLGISQDELSHHAYHSITIESQGAEIALSCKVTGADAYAKGAAQLIKFLMNQELKPGTYLLEDLIDDPMFESAELNLQLCNIEA